MKKDVEQLIREVKTLREKGERLAGLADNKLRILKEKIKSGEMTSGDKITDFTIISLGSYDPKIQKPLRDFDNLINQNKGKQVLVVEKIAGFNDPYHEFRDFIDQRKTKLCLGILDNNLELNFEYKGSKALLPTKNYVIKTDEYGEKKWKLEQGQITIDAINIPDFKKAYSGLHPNFDFHIGMMDNSYIPGETEIFFNNDAEKYFRIAHTRDEDLNFSRIDESYIDARHLLGQKAPADFEEIHAKNIKNEKDEIYSALTRVCAEEGPDKKEGCKKKKIENILERAVELKMHKEPKVLNPKPGHTIDIQKYINGLCKQYDIKIK